MSSAVSIRAARTEDLDALGSIWLEMMQEHAAAHPAFALAPAAPGQWRRLASDMLGRSDGFLLVGERAPAEAASLAGFCLGWVAKNPPIYATSAVGFVSELAVQRAHRRLGVGRALLRAAQQWFSARGLDEVQLATAIWNQPAQAFWRALGGEPFLLRYRFLAPPAARLSLGGEHEP